MSGKLTAEQVRELMEEAKNELLESCEYIGSMDQRQSDVLKAFGKMEQAIADELNARVAVTDYDFAMAVHDGELWGKCSECTEGMGRYADSLCDPLKQRIAELEEQRDELIRCLENDWHIHASWDGLRRFWNIELTEEGVKLRDSLNEVADKWASEKIKAEDYARENMMLKANNGSRWHELFGTPESAAETAWRLLMCHITTRCETCPMGDGCDISTDVDCDDGEAALLEWLRGGAE